MNENKIKIMEYYNKINQSQELMRTTLLFNFSSDASMKLTHLYFIICGCTCIMLYGIIAYLHYADSVSTSIE